MSSLYMALLSDCSQIMNVPFPLPSILTTKFNWISKSNLRDFSSLLVLIFPDWYLYEQTPRKIPLCFCFLGVQFASVLEHHTEFYFWISSTLTVVLFQNIGFDFCILPCVQTLNSQVNHTVFSASWRWRRSSVEMSDSDCLAQHADRSQSFWQLLQRNLRRIACCALAWKRTQSS